MGELSQEDLAQMNAVNDTCGFVISFLLFYSLYQQIQQGEEFLIPGATAMEI